MSDGALSQAEIDALLAGVGSPDAGGSSGPSSGDSDADLRTLQDFLSSTTDAQSSNLSTMTGSRVVITGPQGSFSNRDAFLGQLPDTVTVVKVDFGSGFPGEHLYLMSEAAAKSLAGLMNKEDNIDLDEMAMSVIGEAVGTIVGSQITALTSKTGNKSLSNIPPEAANVPKAVAALPAGSFFSALYQMDLGDGRPHQLWEIFGPSVAGDIARSLAGPDSPLPSGPGMPPPNMGMGNMGGMSGMSGMMGPSANVQPVQFPNLAPHNAPQEAGNISLIMDVFMEMTVELGRTRKLIKEILGMGEGTIFELDKLAGEPVDILVNHKLIAKGEVVVIDENFGVRVTEIVSPQERMMDMG
ncbi:MAG: flagellar motor switch protein FliN [Treponema sp.]|jgi:flagellar motor switch protein FliN/FliY|nr:flagellar motor switch protein FliN [Treponema sp.]